MGKADIFQCTVITPERVVLECAATFVAFPAHDGEMGVLPRRAPLVCKLGIGPLRVQSAEMTHALVIDGGFAQMLGNRLSILTEQAKRAEEIDAAAAAKALETARAMKITDEPSLMARTKAIRRAQAQLKLPRQ